MTKRKSPFRDNSLLKQQISNFLRDYRAFFAQEAKRTSAFFELAAYNDLVKFYEVNNYHVEPKNLTKRARDFIYALSPSARPDTCSYFETTKRYKRKSDVVFEIRHNLRIQSAHDPNIFVSPDYAVINRGAVASTKLPYYYNGKADYFYVEPKNIQMFSEAKHYAPGPELVLNFVGLVNEILPGYIAGCVPTQLPKHIGPSLFVSGVANKHLEYIRSSLAERYSINVFMGMFAYPSQVHSAKNQSNIVKVGTK